MFRSNETQHPTISVRSQHGFRHSIFAGFILMITIASTLLPGKGVLRLFATRVDAQNQSQPPSGKLATDGPPPENLQATQPNTTASSAGRQVLINFDELPVYAVVANQYPDAFFSTDSSDYVIATPQNYGTSLPNISRVSRYGYWVNGFPPYNHFAPLVVDFPKPVNDLAFHIIGQDNFGVIAQIDIYQNSRYTRTEPIYGLGNRFVPVWLNLAGAPFNNGAGYANVYADRAQTNN